jgi:hypothetical protein
MTISRLINFERFFDRSTVAYFLVLGAAAASAIFFAGT